MLRYKTIVIFLAAVAILGACKKKVTVAPSVNTDTGNASISIINTIPDSVYITLNGHDIKTGTLPHIINLTLAPNDTLVLPRADMKDAHRYQYTWYTANYKHSNWFLTDADGLPLKQYIDYYTIAPDYMLQASSPARNELLICMDGDGMSSSWTAIDAFDASGVSVWDTLPARAQNHTFVMSRYHTVKHSYTDTANKAKNTNLAFKLNLTEPRMWLSVTSATDNYVITNNMNSIASLNTQAQDTLYYARRSTDTLGATIYPPPYYRIVRTGVVR